MPKRSIEYLELQALLSSLCDDQITDAQRQRLFEILEADPAARRFYIDYLDLDVSLRWRCAESGDQPPEFGEPLSKPQETIGAKTPGSSVADFLGRCFEGGLSFLGKSNVFSVLVAVFAPIGMCVLMLALVYETPPEPLALIARSRDCVGRLDDQPTTLFAGRNLFEKQRLSLDKGLVEIQFTDGASALIEGPASFEILGGNAGSLTRGRLAAVVPPEAHGFTVETPSVRVVDLGTEFGVLVDDDGRVEAHVFGGQVEVVLPGESADLHGETALLIQGEALHIAAADDKAKSSKIVRIPAAAERFTRSFTPPATAIARPEPAIVLPEPTILFAHRGSADPTTQGWKAHYRQFGEGLPRDGKKLGQLRLAVGPVDEARTEKGGTAAWRVCPLHDDKQVWYVIREGDELTPELRAEAREKGWVLRASVWISDKGPRADQGPNAPCYIVYRDEERSWRLWLLSDEDGNQFARIPEFDVAAVPSSRNQYVDYELRYHPVKKNAELFVNGRRVATHKGSPNGDATDKDDGAFSTIRFGTYRVPTEVRFAKIEWGILRDTEEK